MDIKSFLNHLYSQIRDVGIDPNTYNCDHICWRTSTHDNYLKKKQEFSEIFRFLGETDVNGRPISAFFMPDCEIPLIELPAPKPGKVTIDGLEHAEFVVPSLSAFEKQFSNLKFNYSGMSKSYNQELEIEFANCAAKFHELSLLEVIQTERLQEIEKTNWKDPESVLRFHPNKVHLSSAIERSGVLKKYNALLTGTFPLLLDVDGSDLDFIIESNEKFFESFEIDGIPFEIYGEPTPVFEQNAFRHMLIEAKLIAVTGDWVLEPLRELKRNGLKTEPAFAKFWNIQGDPYEAMLEIKDKDLRNLALKKLSAEA